MKDTMARNWRFQMTWKKIIFAFAFLQFYNFFDVAHIFKFLWNLVKRYSILTWVFSYPQRNKKVKNKEWKYFLERIKLFKLRCSI